MGRIRDRLRRLEPPPRIVDWSLFAFVVAATLTGVVSLGAGHPGNRVVFWGHAVAGVGLAVLVGFKLRRVRHRLADTDRWDRATPASALLAFVVSATLATGVFWASGGNVPVGFWTTLNVHIGLGLLVVPLLFFHLRHRFHRPRRIDFADRRTALRVGGLLVFGALFVRARDVAATAFDAGTDGRFTGSKPVSGEGFPVTSWVADDPDPVDTAAWRLRVDGLVDEPLDLPFDALDGADGGRALLDCTSGWYTVQDWRGVRLGSLLDRAGVADDARWVTVRSVTGYRWSFPLAEAGEMLLATRVGGERLSHGHGAPLRLVAPDRRGFQWVKWVDRVEVRRRRDAGQWLAVLVSGLDGKQ